MKNKSVRISLMTGAILAMASLSGSVFASNSTNTNACSGKIGCEAKACQIETKMGYAKQHDNKSQLARLQKALDSVDEYCTPESLKIELQEKIEDVKEDIEDTQEDIVESSEDLSKAQAKNKADKITKYEKKVAKKRAKLIKKQAKLDNLEARLAELK